MIDKVTRHLPLLAALVAGQCAAIEGDAKPALQPALILPRAAEVKVTGLARDGDAAWAVGERGHVFKVTNQPEQQDFLASQFLNCVSSVDGAVWVAGHDGLIAHRPAQESSWTLQHYAPEREAPLFGIHFMDARHGLAVGGFGMVMHTADGGKTWREVDTEENDAHLYQVKPSPSGSWFVTGEYGTVLEISQAGELLRSVDTGQEATYFGLEVLESGELLIYGLRGRVTLVSEQGVKGLESAELGSIYGSEQYGGRIYLFGDDGNIWTYRDGKLSTTSIGERVVIMDGVALGDELLLATTHGMRRFPINKVQ